MTDAVAVTIGAVVILGTLALATLTWWISRR